MVATRALLLCLLFGVFSSNSFANPTGGNVVSGSASIGHPSQEKVLIKQMMTTHLVSVSPSQTTDECMSLMVTKRIRHLPVLEEGKLLGVISIGDVVNRIIEDHKFSINQLERYVSGEA